MRRRIGFVKQLVTESRYTRLYFASLQSLNSPGLSSVQFSVGRDTKSLPIKDVGELRECIVSAWDELHQRVIDTAVRQ